MNVDISLKLKPEHINNRFKLPTGTSVFLKPDTKEQYIIITVKTDMSQHQFMNFLTDKIKTYDDALLYVLTTTHLMEFVIYPKKISKILYIIEYDKYDNIKINIL